SNLIREFCKLYNFQRQDDLSVSSAASLLKENFNDTFLSEKRENSEKQYVSLSVPMTTSIQPTLTKFKAI
ncbi:unnamed protein product, partial [Rotaria magnacalcarata]